MSAATPPASRFRDFAPRLASALVLAPLVLAAIWAGGMVWLGVATLLALIAMLEWLTVSDVAWGSVAGRVALACMPLAGFLLLGSGSAVCALLAPCALALALRGRGGAGAYLLGWAVLAAADYAQPAIPLAWGEVPLGLGLSLLLAGWFTPRAGLFRLPSLAADGVLYVGLGYVALLVLRAGPGGFADVVFVLLVIWASDVGAYLAGRIIGGPKLWPAVSPGKTWAGAVGGLGAGMAAALLVAHLASPGSAGLRTAVIAASLAIAGQAGDLAESALKRHFGRKDSGHLIPGHGGLLDRVDGLLAAAPLAMVLRISTHGVQLWQ